MSHSETEIWSQLPPLKHSYFDYNFVIKCNFWLIDWCKPCNRQVTELQKSFVLAYLTLFVREEVIWIQAHLNQYRYILTSMNEGLQLYRIVKAVQSGYIDSFILLLIDISARSHSILNTSSTESPRPCWQLYGDHMRNSGAIGPCQKYLSMWNHETQVSGKILMSSIAIAEQLERN